MSQIKKLGYLLLTIFILASCRDRSDSSLVKADKVCKVAVIMPSESQARWDRVAKWALDNIDMAQQGLQKHIRLELEWLDENAAGWEELAARVVDDDSYVAIIGPQLSVHARRMAQLCQKKKKTLILPIATSTEFQRSFAGSGYVWNLSQSDITQCELLLSQAKLSECKEISLLTSDDDYGKSFSDWFAFQVTELGMTVEDIVVYHSENQIREAVRTQYNKPLKYNKALIFAPGSKEDALIFDDELSKLKASVSGFFEFPLLLCSDVMNSPFLLRHLKYSKYEGLSPSATPESGFNSIYQVKYGEEPLSGEAHLFDAITLLSYALTRQEATGESLNDAILAVVDGKTAWNVGWLKDDMCRTFSMLQAGVDVNLSGVTGDWTFDERTHASVLNTTYSHWMLRDGTYATLEYLSTDGGANTISTTQAWEWKNNHMLSFNYDQQDFQYPELQDRWAVVVGASDDWANYRHQADALAMYQLLKRHGYDDDHILFVIEDNIADNPRNLYPGVVKVRPDGENVHTDVHVDYKLSQLSFKQFSQLMQGKKLPEFTQHLPSSPNDNIIIFWCGHGVRNSLAWGSNGDVYGTDIRDMVEKMQYRKLLFVLDACYSGTIGEACEGLPGVLVMTAANADEPSKADMMDPEMGIWLSNGFTRAFQEAIDTNVHISLNDLYYKLARQTVGSHAMVYNSTNYGNMHRNTMEEYLK